MSIFDSLSGFFEQKLEEFLKNNPHLELQVIRQELEQQEKETIRLIGHLKRDQERLQKEILSLAEEIKKWHERVRLAESLGELDLAEAAKEKEAYLLSQGNQTWTKMAAAKKLESEKENLLKQITIRKQEVEQKYKEFQKTNKTATPEPPSSSNNYTPKSKSSFDSLEDKFRELEIYDELQNLKNKINP